MKVITEKQIKDYFKNESCNFSSGKGTRLGDTTKKFLNL